jgi:hypothetical protein
MILDNFDNDLNGSDVKKIGQYLKNEPNLQAIVVTNKREINSIANFIMEIEPSAHSGQLISRPVLRELRNH